MLERKQRFKVLFDRYYPQMCNIAHGYLADEADCEDVVQETFITLWDRKKDDLPETEFASYLTISVKNNCISFLRKNKRMDTVSVEDKPAALTDVPESDSETTDYAALLQQILSTLPPKCREVFEMSKLKKMKYRDIAARLDISEKTVENHMGKALKMIRSYTVASSILIIFITVSYYITNSL